MALHKKIVDESSIELNPLYCQKGEAGHAPRDLADLLVTDLQRHTAYFDQLKTPLPVAGASSFSH